MQEGYNTVLMIANPPIYVLSQTTSS